MFSKLRVRPGTGMEYHKNLYFNLYPVIPLSRFRKIIVSKWFEKLIIIKFIIIINFYFNRSSSKLSDVQKCEAMPYRVEHLLEFDPVERDVRLKHAWNPQDKSNNIYLQVIYRIIFWFFGRRLYVGSCGSNSNQLEAYLRNVPIFIR